MTCSYCHAPGADIEIEREPASVGLLLLLVDFVLFLLAFGAAVVR